MPQCSVPRCTSNTGGHKFPKDSAIRKKWLIAIRRQDPKDKNKLWEPGLCARVCQRHFKQDDYRVTNSRGSVLLKKFLKDDAVPSLNLPNSKDSTPTQREMRMVERTKRELQLETEANEACANVGASFECQMEVSCTEDDGHKWTQTPVSSTTSTETQTETDPSNTQLWSYQKFNDRAIHTYTGLENKERFTMVLMSLGDARFHLQYYNGSKPELSIEDQFLLTLIKLRIHPSHAELAINFSIHEKLVGSIFITWINFMYFQWNEVNWWPDQNLTRYFQPESFKLSHPYVRCILDGTEMPAQKPKKPTAQQASWSSYKNRNTVKVLVGCTPGGIVNYVSDSYGGSASDRQIVERSSLTKLVDPGDHLLVDKGFNCDDIFLPYHVKQYQPSFFKKKNRLSAETVRADRKIASKRVHIERIIGLAKTYKILRVPLSPLEISLSDQIITTCFRLCNFRPNIM